jgi:hypothetical protein
MVSPTDHELNAVGVLTRRTIEARVLAPVLAALGEAFGREQVLAIARRAIADVARTQGSELAAAYGGKGLPQFGASLERWTADGALEIEVLESSDERFDFNVTRCRNAEMYRALGIPELGAVLSCGRDAALIEGFNPDVELTRSQTILGGATHCDFRYRLQRRGTPAG